MSDSAASPFGYDMFEKMWGMFRNAPFAGQFPSPFGAAGTGAAPSMSMMSDMVAPLTNVEELDKRIEEMRAVEQWLKLNLNMLQSAIQALEVQRATLATLRAFGAFAQSSVAAAAEAGAAVTRESAKAAEPSSGGARQAEEPRAAASQKAEPEAGTSAVTGMNAAFDPNGWWNLLQSQFNQIAGLAAASAAAGQAAAQPDGKPAANPRPATPSAKSAGTGSATGGPPAAKAPAAAKTRPKAPAKAGAKTPKAVRTTTAASISVPAQPGSKASPK